jgi:hypothetical protein
MAHLIQPIEVDGTPFCPNQGKATHTIGRAWRTLSVLAGTYAALNTTEEDDSWTLVVASGSAGTGLTGSVQFGTTCVDTIELEFKTDRDSAAEVIVITITINDVEVPGSPIIKSGPASTEQTDTLTLNLTDVACGSVISISVVQDSYAATSVHTRVKVLDVT